MLLIRFPIRYMHISRYILKTIQPKLISSVSRYVKLGPFSTCSICDIFISLKFDNILWSSSLLVLDGNSIHGRLRSPQWGHHHHFNLSFTLFYIFWAKKTFSSRKLDRWKTIRYPFRVQSSILAYIGGWGFLTWSAAPWGTLAFWGWFGIWRGWFIWFLAFCTSRASPSGWKGVWLQSSIKDLEKKRHRTIRQPSSFDSKQ